MEMQDKRRREKGYGSQLKDHQLQRRQCNIMICHSCFLPAVVKQIDMYIYCTSPTNKYLNLPSPKNTKDTFFHHHRYREKDSRN